jgi:hypothetical protein
LGYFVTQATKPAWRPGDDRPERPDHHTPGLERQRAWVEVDAAAIAANANSLRRHLNNRSQLMAVVKADGYGHGAVTVARAAKARLRADSHQPPRLVEEIQGLEAVHQARE